MFNVGKLPIRKKIPSKTKITPEDVFRLLAKWEDFTDYDEEQLEIGIEIEMEHIDMSVMNPKKDMEVARKIASWITKAHLSEDYWYYARLIHSEKESDYEQDAYKFKGWDYRLYPPYVNK